MKLTNQQILNFVNSGIQKKYLPIKLAYGISVNLSSIEPALIAYNKQREELIEKYVKKDDDGKPLTENGFYVFKDRTGWDKSITELLETKAEVSITQVPERVLIKCDNPEFDSLTVPELLAIQFMIKQQA